jgi:hypothetical protein
LAASFLNSYDESNAVSGPHDTSVGAVVTFGTMIDDVEMYLLKKWYILEFCGKN